MLPATILPRWVVPKRGILPGAHWFIEQEVRWAGLLSWI